VPLGCCEFRVTIGLARSKSGTLNLSGVALNNTPNIGINQTDFIQSLDLVGSVRDCYGSILISVLDYNVHI